MRLSSRRASQPQRERERESACTEQASKRETEKEGLIGWLDQLPVARRENPGSTMQYYSSSYRDLSCFAFTCSWVLFCVTPTQTRTPTVQRQGYDMLSSTAAKGACSAHLIPTSHFLQQPFSLMPPWWDKASSSPLPKRHFLILHKSQICAHVWTYAGARTIHVTCVVEQRNQLQAWGCPRVGRGWRDLGGQQL